MNVQPKIFMKHLVPSASRHLKAFTRADLTGLIAGIALVGMLGFPAIGSTRSKSQQEVCADNLQALMRATRLYAEDHRDEFPMVTHGGDALAGSVINFVNRNSSRPWATGWQTWSTSEHNTNTAFLVDSRYAVLADYTRDARLYKCPADTLLHPTQKDLGWLGRARTYSANIAVGRGNKHQFDGLVGAEKLFIRFSDIDRPSPSQLFVFIEENPDSMNDPALSNSQVDRRWIDMPGAFHPTVGTNHASNVAFSDGHIETHAWQASVLLEKPTYSYFPPTIQRGDPDWAWLMDRTSFNPRAIR